MTKDTASRRHFLRVAGIAAGAGFFDTAISVDAVAALTPQGPASLSGQSGTGPPNYTLRIGAAPIEIAPKHIVSAITYNGQFPGPLLRFKEGQP